jgi:hypothetical protein
LRLENSGTRVCDLILGPPSDRVWLADRLEEVVRWLWLEQAEHWEVDAEMEGLRSSTTQVQDMVLGGPVGTSSDRDRFKETSWDGPIFTAVGFATKIICCKQWISSFIPDKGVVATK